MSLEELAAKIYKSKASLSKYELGQTTIDILTLSELASALDVMLFQLLEAETGQCVPFPSADHPFGKINQLYLYHMVDKKLYSSLLHFGPRDQEGRMNVTLYFQADDVERMNCCSTIPLRRRGIGHFLCRLAAAADGGGGASDFSVQKPGP